MIDLGQYATQSEISDRHSGNHIWASLEEHQLRHTALESDAECDWQAYHAMRSARLARCAEMRSQVGSTLLLDAGRQQDRN